MIYMQATIQLRPGTLDDFAETLHKEYIPVAQKHGMKLVASWRCLVGPAEEVTDIWAFESLAHWEKVRQSQAQDPVWRAAYNKVRSYCIIETLKLLTPLPFSPM